MFNNQFTPVSGIQSPDNINVFDRSSTPTLVMGSKVNDLWFNTTTSPGVWYQCTSVSPLTWTAASGSGGNLTGDVTSVGLATTLATVNSNVGTYNLANITVNGKGLVTAASAPTTTGSGNVVLSTSPTLVTPVLGTVTSGDVSACTSTSMVMITPVLGTPTSGTFTNCTGYTDAHLSLSDITTNNVSTSNHGFTPKLDNVVTHFLNGQGGWTTPSGLPNGSQYQILNADSNGTYYYPSRLWLSASTGDRCDFTSASSPQYGTNTASSGNASINQFGGSSPSTGQGFGWIKLQGNGNATGEASAFFPNGNCFSLTGGQITLEASLYVTALSTSSNRYKLTFGLGDTNLSSTIGTYCIIQYTDNVNSGQWEVISRSGGTTNTVTSSIAPAANTVYRLKCIINAAGTSASFYYANASGTDTLIGTTNADLPTATQLYFFVDMQETVGTSTPVCWLDYMQYEQQFTVLR